MSKSLLLVLILWSGALAQAGSQWDPRRTHVLVASITRWPAAAGLDPFDGTRRDQALVDQFKAAGVPAANVTFLKDSAATHAAMRKGLQAVAERSGPEDTLIFCFQGHGGQKLLYCYDYDEKRPEKTVFHMEEIYPLLEKWKGSRLLLIGDCCSSGSLHSVLQQFEKKRPEVRVGSFTSAMASNTSTGNWTFTDGLIRIFAGDPLVDKNHDGKLAASEARDFLHRQMKYKEDQLASITFSANFEPDFVLCPVAPNAALAELAGPYQIGDLLEARDSEGEWYPAEIIGAKGAGPSYRVHYSGFDDEWDEWVDRKKLRPIVKPKLDLAKSYEVQWQKKWYPVKITKAVEDYFYFVQYEGSEGEDDEWITGDRARLARKQTERKSEQYAGRISGERESAEGGPVGIAGALALGFEVGTQVAAQREEAWSRARITARANGKYTVRFEDGATAKLAADQMLQFAAPKELRQGERVLACWEEGGQMYPGRIQRITGDKVTVRWEDGSTPSKVSNRQVARIERDSEE